MPPDLSPGEALERLLAFDGELRLEAYYGERSVFYNPRGVAPLGVIFASVKERVGAEVAQVSPATYRERLERTRRAVADPVRDAAGGDHDSQHLATAARELDDLVRLGELHRAHARGATAAGAVRALERVAPTLAA
jgi:hypothetical protein